MFTYTWRGQSREMHVDIHETSPQILDSDQAIAQIGSTCWPQFGRWKLTGDFPTGHI